MDKFIHLNIRHLRIEKNLDQQMLGDQIGVSRDVVSSYERGKAVPKLETIMAICEYFKISIDDFINKDLRKVQAVEPGHYYKDPLIGALANENAGSTHAAPYVNIIADLRSQLADKNKIIQMLEAEVKRLRGDQENNNSKTA